MIFFFDIHRNISVEHLTYNNKVDDMRSFLVGIKFSQMWALPPLSLFKMRIYLLAGLTYKQRREKRIRQPNKEVE